MRVAEFLHHGCEQRVPFPLLSDSHETLSALLPSATLATFTTPVRVPTPSQLTSSYWREQRSERGPHIPILNFDKTDNLIYVFKRNQSSPQTRVLQVTSPDKLLRLQSELLSFLELAMRLQRPFKRPISMTTRAPQIL